MNNTNIASVIDELRVKAGQMLQAAETLAELNGAGTSTAQPAKPTFAPAPAAKPKRKVSLAARAKMRAAQQRRWKLARASKLGLVAKKGA